MPKPYDATLKELIETYPADWLAAVGVPPTSPVEVLSADLSTVTATADALIRIGDAVIHIDAQSGPDPSLATRMLLYNVLIHRHTGLPVHSIVVMLRPNANPGGLKSEVGYSVRPEGELKFRFEVIRVWEEPAERVTTMGVGLLPLAVLGRPPEGMSRRQAIPRIIEQVAARAAEQLPPDEASKITASAMVLAGMYLSDEEIRSASLRLPAMIETTTFRAWEKMGREWQLHDTLLALGRAKFGDPTPEQEQTVRAIEDLDRLNRMTLAVLKARSWAGLLRTR